MPDNPEGCSRSARHASDKQPPSRRRSTRRDDSGQLMMLAGVILTSAFVTLALLPMEISDLERTAASELQRAPWVDDWREIRLRLVVELPRGASYARTADDFQDRTLPKIFDTYKEVLASRALHGTLVIDADAETAAHDAFAYDAWTVTGQHLEIPYDGTDDGLIWDASCQPPEDGTAGCFIGVLLRIEAGDETMNIAETILVST